MASTSTDQIDLVALLGTLPAEGALFTTFTLSLSWFEVYLHRRLERQGARRVAILADGEGVAMSLREGLARGPGLRYGLEAIHLPRGTFHPKVALVWGGGRIALAVGSGNLTLPGMQRNLECWDVFLGGWPETPDHAVLSRGVASGADGFLGTLLTHLDAGAWSAGVVAQARTALRTIMPGLPDRDDVWWLDSGRRPVGEQVAELLGSEPRELEFLSPFHDPAGSAVRDLGRQTGATELALLYADDTTFPLSRARREWRGGVAARRVHNTARPLHAKVYRWRSKAESWLLSGSANATRTALWTTDNIEACVLRRGGPGAWDALLASTPGQPVERPAPPITAGATPLRILHARASDRGVTVKMAATGPPPAEVRLSYLEHGGEETRPWDGGGAVIPLPGAHDPLRPAPLRVEVEADVEGTVVRARAWVSFETWLEASPAWRRIVSTWARLLRDESEDEEEEIELLNVFAEEHSRTMGALGALPKRSSGERGEGSKPDLPVPVRLLELAASRERMVADLGMSGANPSTIDGVLAAMTSAFRSLDEVVERGSDEDDPDGKEPTPSRPPSQRARDALDDFEQRFLDHGRALTTRPASASRVLAYAGLCARLALRLRVRDEARPDLVWRTADRWVRALLLPRSAGMPLLSVLGPKERDTQTEVLALFSGLLAALLWRARGGRLEGEPTGAADRSLLGVGPLREALATLRRFDSGAPDRAALPAELARRMVSALTDPDRVLEEAGREPAPSDRMRWLIEAAGRAARKVAIAELDAEAETAGFGFLNADERELLRDARQGRRPVPTTPWPTLCPACRGNLSVVARSRLGGRVPTRCTSMTCATWLVPSEGS